jgi:1-acyl-sn-glycerol-3-phosphate acyltransferase
MDVIKSIILWIIGIGFIIIFFPITFIVWIIAFPFDRKRSAIHWILMLQSFLLAKMIPIWKIKIEGREKAVKGATYVIISNHQSVLDTLIINCLRYKFKWVSKIENMKLPVLGWYLRMADYIAVNRGNEESKVEMLEKSLNCLKSGISVMLFPEGTRSKDMDVALFKRGAFQLAIHAGVPVLPIMLDGTGGILPKHGLIFGSGFNITIRVLDPVHPDAFPTSNVDELSEVFRMQIASQLKELRSKTTKK